MREMTVADARDGFTAHAALYVLVMAALIVLDLFLTGVWWFVIPLVGWGVVLALHYLSLRRVGKADATRQAWTNQQAPTARRVA
jgi:2TM domain